MGGGCLIAAAALKTPTRNGYNAQGVNLTFCVSVVKEKKKEYNERNGVMQGERVSSPYALRPLARMQWQVVLFGLYKILFCFWDFVYESILFLAQPPFVEVPYPTPSSPAPLRNITFPHDLPLLQYIPHNIGTCNIV